MAKYSLRFLNAISYLMDITDRYEKLYDKGLINSVTKALLSRYKVWCNKSRQEISYPEAERDFLHEIHFQTINRYNEPQIAVPSRLYFLFLIVLFIIAIALNIVYTLLLSFERLEALMASLTGMLCLGVGFIFWLATLACTFSSFSNWYKKEIAKAKTFLKVAGCFFSASIFFQLLCLYLIRNSE